MASTRSWTEREATRILSMPGCEHPDTSTNPFDVRNASDNSRISRVPGTSETTETAQTSGTSSVVSLTQAIAHRAMGSHGGSSPGGDRRSTAYGQGAPGGGDRRSLEDWNRRHRRS